MSGKVALIAGATGLIGRQLLQILLEYPEYNLVKALVRRESHTSASNPKLREIVVDFDSLEAYHDRLSADHIFCCLGTTMNKAGGKEEFRKVDYHYPQVLAELTQLQGATQYHLTSSLGADKQSKVFYNKVKGEVEEAVGAIGFETYHIYRPSLLLGNRNETRYGEDAAKVFFNLFGFLFRGPLKKYRAIDSEKVAKAMHLFAAANDQSGTIIHESEELQGF